MRFLFLAPLIFFTACSTPPPEKPVPARVSFVTLAVDDIKVMSAFFDRLEWPRSTKSTDFFVAYKTGGAILGLWPRENFAKDQIKKEFKNFGGIMLAINVETPQKVDDALLAVKKAGGQIVIPAKNTSWGGRSGTFRDPEGNLWEISWAQGTSFDERGALYFP